MAVFVQPILLREFDRLRIQRDLDKMAGFLNKYDDLMSFHGRQFSPGCTRAGALARLRLCKRICEKLLSRLGPKCASTRRRLSKIETDCVREIELCRTFVVKNGGVPLIADRISAIEKELELILHTQEARGGQKSNAAFDLKNPWEGLLIRQFKARREESAMAAAARLRPVVGLSPNRNICDNTSDDHLSKQRRSLHPKASTYDTLRQSGQPALRDGSVVGFVVALRQATEEDEARVTGSDAAQTNNHDVEVDDEHEYSDSGYCSENSATRAGRPRSRGHRDSGYQTETDEQTMMWLFSPKIHHEAFSVVHPRRP